MNRTQVALVGWLIGALLGVGVAYALDVYGPWSWLFPGALALALIVVSVVRWANRPRILPKEKLDHAREQADMRKALYDLLAPAKYGRSNFMPDTSDRYRRAQLREFLREILDGRGDE